MNAPDVSVVIPTYNRAEMVCRATRSCFDQDDCAIEVIVVDDGSTDDTRITLSDNFGIVTQQDVINPTDEIYSRNEINIKTSCEQKKVKYFYQKNQGACVARNIGLKAATGQYVKFLDSDDELIPGSLAKELSFARETGADVVVTGYQLRTYDFNRSTFIIDRHIPAPHLEKGVDDMLLGIAPWTSAALYSREFIAKLEWNPEIQKAQDWDWAWTVCLTGASFMTLDIESSIYNNYSGHRITSEGNPFLRSTETRQRILRIAENKMREQGQLTMDRCVALAQYYYKDSKALCELDPSKWRKLWLHCQTLVPGFKPVEQKPIARPFVKYLGAYWGVWLYVKFKKVAGLMGLSRPK
jgi:glycosyltransferase involved in cell wall biosynthesis